MHIPAVIPPRIITPIIKNITTRVILILECLFSHTPTLYNNNSLVDESIPTASTVT